MAAKAKYAWLDGEFVDWDDAKVHITTECVTSGANVFEGVRAYWSARQQELYVVQLAEHMQRLEQSMKVLRMQLPYSVDTIAEAAMELLRRCEIREDSHFRATVYFGTGEMFGIENTFVGSFIAAVPRPQRPSLKVGMQVAT